jgi:hypothetical protein
LRSILFRAFFFAPFALTAAIVVGAGCAAQSTSKDLEGAPESASLPPNDPETAFPPTDASATGKSPFIRGSPLCNVSAGSCLPDDEGKTARPYGVQPCADADASTVTYGCRIVGQSNRLAPNCEVKAERRGVDGVACTRGSDCAPGFDCVKGDKGGVCRRYCCAGSTTCDTLTAQNGGVTFCDIQELVDVGRRAPVCMPVKKCKLLVAGECDDGETCAVVTDKGETGCVETGNAQAGAPCDEEHCAAGLTCIGNAGDRRCYTLCRTGGDPCGPDQTCTPGTVLPEMIGICKTK